MSATTRKTAMELQADLGSRLRELRKGMGLSQAELARDSGISERSIRNLEKGEGSSIHTLVLVLKALGADGDIEAIAPAPSVSPMRELSKRASRSGRHQTAYIVKKWKSELDKEKP
ncbi:MAG: helix-turn-helix transcriptional regulator [Rhodanobacteraceae bacterium]